MTTPTKCSVCGEPMTGGDKRHSLGRPCPNRPLANAADIGSEEVIEAFARDTVALVYDLAQKRPSVGALGIIVALSGVAAAVITATVKSNPGRGLDAKDMGGRFVASFISAMQDTTGGEVAADNPIPTEAPIVARPIDEYHEDMGPVLWCFFPIQEAPYCGSPLDEDFPEYLTHFIPLPDFNRVVPAAG